MSGKSFCFLVGGLALLLLGCSAPPSNTLPMSGTAGPTHTVTPYPTSTRRPTQTPGPSRTPWPTQTPTIRPTPTITLTPVQPGALPLPTEVRPLDSSESWYLFNASLQPYLFFPTYLYALNLEGTDLRLLMHEPVIALRPLRQEGQRLEYLAVATGDPSTSGEWALNLLHLSSGEITRLATIADVATSEELRSDLMVALDWGGLSWSPDGRWLALPVAAGRETVDIVLYNRDNAALLEWDQEPDSPISIRWSLDGRYLVYSGYADFEMIAPVAGSLVAISLETGRIQRVFDRESYENAQRGLNYVGINRWLEGSQLLIGYGGSLGEAHDYIEWVDLDSGLRRVIADMQEYRSYGYSPDQQVWLAITRSHGIPPHLHRINLDATMRDLGETRLSQIAWSQSVRAFVGKDEENRLYQVNLDGTLIDYPVPASTPTPEPPWPVDERGINLQRLPSPDGGSFTAWIRRHNQRTELLLTSAAAPSPRVLLSFLGQADVGAHWDSTGKLWIYGPGGLWIAQSPDFTPRLIAGGMHFWASPYGMRMHQWAFYIGDGS